VVAVTKGKLDFGPWEQIFYGEFDGRGESGHSLKSSASDVGRRRGIVVHNPVQASQCGP
jgi:hypothetical protein